MDPIYLVNLVVVAGLMTLVWLVSVVIRDASIVDPMWGMAFVAIAWSTFLQLSAPGDGRPLLIVALVTIWGLRLSLYLGWRKTRMGEDPRYARMRERVGPSFPIVSLAVVFLLQAALAWIVALPVQAGQLGSSGLGPLDLVGIAVWMVGIAFEAVGDLQLTRFKADPSNAGRVLDRGLWRYTRHPNYFGDFLVWWGLYLVAVAAGAPWTVVGPILMSILLIRVSGVALLERTMAERRPGYAAYVRRTSAFFPRPPREP